jgi:hypothetical protein
MAKLSKTKCFNCGKIFYRPTRRFNEAIKFGWHQFCSFDCQFKFKTKKRTILKCENCGKKFKRISNNISPHNYCSGSCAAIANNKKRPERGALEIKCRYCGKKFKRWIVGNKKYCSRRCMTLDKSKTPEELISIIQKKYKKLKRVPSRREMDKVYEACRKIFGTWNRAILAAGLIPNRSDNNRMYKRIMGKAKDGHFCDSVSEILIDNWLYKNKISHQKNALYPDTNHKADWQITLNGKPIFVEYFGLANDSPRYDRAVKRKIILCKEQKIPLVAIYPKDIYPKNNFENNLKNKFKDYFAA